MKQIIFSLIALAAFGLSGHAQEASADSLLSKKASDANAQSEAMDTTIVKIGKKEFKIIGQKDNTEIACGDDKHKKSGKFDGHWEGLEIGFNAFARPDYSMYNDAGKDFMSLNQGKSLEIDLNFYELNIGLMKSYVGLVSGLGMSFNNYRFDNPYTIQKVGNMTEPAYLTYDNLSKTKLAVSYLNVPLLLEFQIPVNHNEGRLFINAGIIGSAKIGSHTKVKNGDIKDKVRDGFNLNSFSYASSVKIGYKDVGLFAKYSLTSLFESGKGPELTPFTIGICFLD
jgi:hypothetical protein